MTSIQKDTIYENIGDFSQKLIENFLNIFQNESKEYLYLKKSLNLLQFLREYPNIINNNSKLIEKYMDIVHSLIQIINYNSLLSKKEVSFHELELSKIKNKTNDLAAKTDLMNKLNDAIIHNKKKLEYLKEDFFKLKDQLNQIKKTITAITTQIQDLNQQKKSFFNEINRITRAMGDISSLNINDDANIKIEEKSKSSVTEKILAYRKQASLIQSEINQLNIKLNETKLNLDIFGPKYEKLKKDYQSLEDIINSDENSKNKLKSEIENKFRSNEHESFKDFNFKRLDLIKPTQEIESELQLIEIELNKIKESSTFLDTKTPENLSEPLKKLNEIKEIIENEKNSLVISLNIDEIKESIKNFRALEYLINNLESILNKFLSQINLRAFFQIAINSDFKNFNIQLQFNRVIRENVVFKFDDLTTPEKIFFVISANISMKVLLNYEWIIFSNLFLSTQYNKRGSIFRTIRKILPIFQNEENLKRFNLVFVISNLQMKNPIENLKIIKV